MEDGETERQRQRQRWTKRETATATERTRETEGYRDRQSYPGNICDEGGLRTVTPALVSTARVSTADAIFACQRLWVINTFMRICISRFIVHTRTQTQTHTHANSHTHARTRAHTHARTHTHTRLHRLQSQV